MKEIMRIALSAGSWRADYFNFGKVKLRFTSNRLKETLRNFFHQLANRVFYSCIDIFLSSSVERSNYVFAKRTQPTSFKNYIPRPLVS